MADDPKPITTQFANKENRSIEFGGGPASGQEGAQHNPENDQKISVRALRTFHEHENMHGKQVHPGDEFECTRGRAAELRANGLIEYVSDGEAAKIHGEVGAKKIDERVKREQDQAKIPERHKTSPLRNPELKLGEVDPKDDPREDKSDKSKPYDKK